MKDIIKHILSNMNLTGLIKDQDCSNYLRYVYYDYTDDLNYDELIEELEISPMALVARYTEFGYFGDYSVFKMGYFGDCDFEDFIDFKNIVTNRFVNVPYIQVQYIEKGYQEPLYFVKSNIHDYHFDDEQLIDSLDVILHKEMKRSKDKHKHGSTTQIHLPHGITTVD